jgi:hypothetical protein
MPLNTDGYRDFSVAVQPSEVYSPHVLEVRVDPGLNNGADVLCIYSGVMTLSQPVKGTSQSAWRRGDLNAGFPTGSRKWQGPGVSRGPGWTAFRDGAAILMLSSIYNAEVANHAGWAVDAAIVEPITQINEGDHLRIHALLAVRDSDGYIYRLSFQVTALGQTIV